MKFNHADSSCEPALAVRHSFVRMICMMGLLLLTIFENISIVSDGTWLIRPNGVSGLTHATSAGALHILSGDELLPTEAFLSPEQKLDPFQSLVSLRDLFNWRGLVYQRSPAMYLASLYRSTGAHLAPLNRYAALLRSAQLRC